MKPLGNKISGASGLSPTEKETLKRAEALFAAKEFRRCIDLLEAPIQAGDASLAMHRLYAEALFKKKLFAESLPSFSACLRAWSISAPFSFFQMTRTAVGKVLPPEEEEAFWRSCSDPASVIFERAMRSLLEGDYAAAETSFSQGAAEVFADRVHRAFWEKSFRFLLDALRSNIVGVYDYTPRKIRKVMVSGLGWSGSGAVYDYLLEFDDIKGVKGESQYLEGTSSIKRIMGRKGNRDSFVNAVVTFFFFSLLGYAEWAHPGAFKSFRTARKHMTSRYARRYAEDVTCISYLLARCLVSHGDTAALNESLSVLLNETANRMVVGPDFDTDKIAVLDNVIHISNITLATHILDLDIFCTFRDPRSNYAALVAESSGFVSDADEYVEKFRSRLPKLVNGVAKAQKAIRASAHTRIHHVQFEEFVLSEPYRIRLAKALGVNFSAQQKHSRFKPWESMRNVILHQTYDKPEEIKKIEDALGDYCYEPSAIKLNELG